MPDNGLMQADVVVIGAGAFGLSTALHCALLGRSVIVVERETAGSQASGRAAGLFKSVQADELRTALARRSIDQAVTFGDWAGVPLDVASSGSFLVARTDQHRAYLRPRRAQSRGWGADVREASPADLRDGCPTTAGRPSDLALWCPEDVYVEEPMSLVQAYLARLQQHGAEVLESEAVMGVTHVGGTRGRGARPRRRSITCAVAWTRRARGRARWPSWPGPAGRSRSRRSATSC